jgi:hypothetical protein
MVRMAVKKTGNIVTFDAQESTQGISITVKDVSTDVRSVLTRVIGAITL